MRLIKRYKNNFSYRVKKYSDKVERVKRAMVEFDIYDMMKQIEDARILYYDLGLTNRIYGTDIITPEENESGDIKRFGIVIRAPGKSKTELTIKNRYEMHKIYKDIKYYKRIAEITRSSAINVDSVNKISNLIEDHVRGYRDGEFETPESLMNKYKKTFGYINEQFSKDIEIFGYDRVEMFFKFDKRQIPKEILEIVENYDDYEVYEKVKKDKKVDDLSKIDFDEIVLAQHKEIERIKLSNQGLSKEEIENRLEKYNEIKEENEKIISTYYFIHDIENSNILYLDKYTADFLFTFTIEAKGESKKEILKIQNMPCFVVPGFIEFLAKSIRWD